MYSFARHKAPFTHIFPLFFLFVFLGPVVSPYFVYKAANGFDAMPILSVPIATAVVLAQKPIENSLPVALKVPVIVPNDPPKIVAPIVAVVAPKAILKIFEARLAIPSLNVDAVIKDMGFTPSGAMAVPSNSVDVGWFSPGTRPGAMGSAVIGAHNLWDGVAGVFDNLDRLKIGDVMSVTDANGVSFAFVVREMRTYAPTDSGADIFNSPGGVHLNLITCSGVWDPSTKSYNKRLVIFTDLVSPKL
jgi:LPXTG-site transpeptidase (sortase) family protein